MSSGSSICSDLALPARVRVGRPCTPRGGQRGFRRRSEPGRRGGARASCEMGETAMDDLGGFSAERRASVRASDVICASVRACVHEGGGGASDQDHRDA